MSSRVVIYDKAGAAVADVRAGCNRSWRLDQYGEAQFVISLNDAAARLQFLEFGNFITVEREGLPMWAGVIDPPRSWGRRAIVCSAYSGEYLLSWRRSDVEVKLTGSAGDIYQQIIALANQPGYLRVAAGDIWTGGSQREETIQPTTSLYEEVKRVAKRAECNWNFTPDFDGQGRLYFKANWYEKQGVDRMLALEEGWNLAIGDNPVEEQGQILNQVVGYGDGGTWADRPKVSVKDDTSIARYGLRQGSKAFGGATYTGTLTDNATSEVNSKRNPRTTYTLTALDKGDTLANVRVGDRLPVRFVTAGFSGDGFGLNAIVRVVGMAWDDGMGVLELVADEEVT